MYGVSSGRRFLSGATDLTVAGTGPGHYLGTIPNGYVVSLAQSTACVRSLQYSWRVSHLERPSSLLANRAGLHESSKPIPAGVSPAGWCDLGGHRMTPTVCSPVWVEYYRLPSFLDRVLRNHVAVKVVLV